MTKEEERRDMKDRLMTWIEAYGIKSIIELVLEAFNALEDNKE